MLANMSLLNLYGINMNVELDFNNSKIVLFLKVKQNKAWVYKKEQTSMYNNRTCSCLPLYKFNSYDLLQRLQHKISIP